MPVIPAGTYRHHHIKGPLLLYQVVPFYLVGTTSTRYRLLLGRDYCRRYILHSRVSVYDKYFDLGPYTLEQASAKVGSVVLDEVSQSIMHTSQLLVATRGVQPVFTLLDTLVFLSLLKVSSTVAESLILRSQAPL